MPYTVTSAKAFGTAASKGPLLLRCMVGADIMVFAGVELEEARDAVRKGTQDFKVVTPPPPVRIPLDLRKWW